MSVAEPYGNDGGLAKTEHMAYDDRVHIWIANFVAIVSWLCAEGSVPIDFGFDEEVSDRAW